MDRSRLNPGQLRCVTSFGRTLMVCAGAGSGKTFTLANRIVYAFAPESGGGVPILDDIDRVCAITFTKAAAGELRARVKAFLRADGRYGQALRTDDAWISTIHGMCSRILKENALVLGLDADFDILADRDYDNLLDTVLDEALSRGMESLLGGEDGPANSLDGENPDAEALAERLRAEGRTFAEGELNPADMLTLMGEFGVRRTNDMLRMVLAQAKRTGYGWRGITFLNALSSPLVYANLLRDAYRAYIDVVTEDPKPGAAAQQVPACEAAAVRLDALIEAIARAPQEDAAELMAEALPELVSPPANAKGTIKPFAVAIQHELLRFALGLRIIQGEPFTGPLVRVAQAIDARFAEEKRRRGVLDNDDLVIRTLHAFDEHPQLARIFANRFRMVLVDEFQDTNQLQLDLIARLAGEDLVRLCTVGDTQQSIYRFQGADVGVARAHLARVQGELGGEVPKLDINYRSHGDILAFVEEIFKGDEAFGEEFLHLDANPTRKGRWPSGEPRIIILSTHAPYRGADEAVREAEAEAIASRFANLLEAARGTDDALRQQDMVILLGRMKYARVYADALTRHGIHWVITGGSVLGRLPEAQAIVALARMLRDTADDEALYQVLSGEMFRVPESELLALVAGRARSLHEGFDRLLVAATKENSADGRPNQTCLGEFGEKLPHAVFAARVIADAVSRRGTEGLSALLRDVVQASGWVHRLAGQGAEGLAVVANILKAIRIAQRFEDDCIGGLAEACEEFTAFMEMKPKETPGALSGAEGDVVRLMTIHASKGLEFPVVAVAEYEPFGYGSRDLIIEGKDGPHTFVDTLLSGLAFDTAVADTVLGKATIAGAKPGSRKSVANAFDSDDALEGDIALLASMYAADEDDEDEAERLRLLYVALTRAREAIILPVRSTEKTISQGKEKVRVNVPKEMAARVCTGIFDAESFPQEACAVGFKGSAPAVFMPLELPETGSVAQEALSEQASDPCIFRAPATYAIEAGLPALPGRDSAGTFSYSGISDAADHGPAAQEDAEEVPAKASPRLRPAPIVDESEGDQPARHAEDNDKATDFGSAFHLCAQYAIEAGAPPARERILTIAKGRGVQDGPGPKDLPALEGALERWFKGSAYAFAAASPYARAEVPFFVALEDAYLEGSIDLLCADGPIGPGTRATLFDYKTGGRDGETPQARYYKHLLQAQCYAYALLLQGCESVDAHFVRVQHRSLPDLVPYAGEFAGQAAFPDADTIDYRFTAADLPALRAIIAATRLRHQQLEN